MRKLGAVVVQSEVEHDIWLQLVPGVAGASAPSDLKLR